MKIVIHVNQHKIKSNLKHGERVPVLTSKSFKGSIRGKNVDNVYSHEVVIRGKDGCEVARVVYSPDKPLSCGARVWIETDQLVECLVDGEVESVLNGN